MASHTTPTPIVLSTQNVHVLAKSQTTQEYKYAQSAQHEVPKKRARNPATYNNVLHIHVDGNALPPSPASPTDCAGGGGGGGGGGRLGGGAGAFGDIIAAAAAVAVRILLGEVSTVVASVAATLWLTSLFVLLLVSLHPSLVLALSVVAPSFVFVADDFELFPIRSNN